MTLLPLAARLDRWEARARRLAEKLGWPQAWLHEFQAHLGQPRMTPEEFWVRYTLKRIEAEPRIGGQLTQQQAEAFYQESDYMLWRNVVHRRHSAWRRVLWTMPRHGVLVEVGCGIAPVSAYCVRYRPEWTYHLIDLESPHLAYALWRMHRRAATYRGWPSFGFPASVITLLDVLEHLANPLAMAKQAVARLAAGGYLHANFVGNPQRNDLDLATPEQREETLAYLAETLEPVWDGEYGYAVWRKR